MLVGKNGNQLLYLKTRKVSIVEKIQLNNNQIFEIIPMGIDTNAFEKTRKFNFISKLNYGEIETIFVNKENISEIKYLSASDQLLKIYTDCIGLKIIAKEFNKEYEDGKFEDIYTVVLELS